MNTKRYALQVMAAVAIVVGLVIALGMAGDVDYCDQVILNMSQEEYDSVKHHLESLTGDTPSERDIAHWWVNNRKQ